MADGVRFLVNSRTGPLADRPSDGATRAFHARLPGYAPTPLLDAPSLAAELGLGRLVVKDESSRLGLPAFKMLGASWATYRMLCQRLGEEPEWATLDDLGAAVASLGPLSIVAATDGNHGRAVARFARLIGLSAEILVPRGTVAARIDAIRDEGAAVDVVDGTYDDAVAESARRADSTHLVVSDTSWPSYEDVPRWVIDGYDTIFSEIDDQLDGASVDAAVIQIGVGALACAAARHLRVGDRRTPWLLGVEPASAACMLASIEAGAVTEAPGPHESIMAGLNCGLPSLIALPVVTRAFDALVAISDDHCRDAMRRLAAVGIVAGETGAAGLAGLAAALADPTARASLPISDKSTVLVICTEGATDPVGYDEIVGADG